MQLYCRRLQLSGHHRLRVSPTQTTKNAPCGTTQDKAEKQSFFNYFYLAINIGSLIACTVIVWVQVRRVALIESNAGSE